jgi:hypothetical protein
MTLTYEEFLRRQGAPSNNQQAPVTEPEDTDFEALIDAFSEQESGGNWGIQNPIGATGRFQVMPKNVASWTREVLGQELSPEDFANDPVAQARVVREKLRQYWKQRAGNIDEIAKDWYGRGDAGPGHPTPNEYASQLRARWEAAKAKRGGATDPANAPGTLTFDAFVQGQAGTAGTAVEGETPAPAVPLPPTAPAQAQGMADRDPRLGPGANNSMLPGVQELNPATAGPDNGVDAFHRAVADQIGLGPNTAAWTPQDWQRFTKAVQAAGSGSWDAYQGAGQQALTQEQQQLAGGGAGGIDAARQDYARRYEGVVVPQHVAARGPQAVRDYFRRELFGNDQGAALNAFTRLGLGKAPEVLLPGTTQVASDQELEQLLADSRNYDPASGGFIIRTSPEYRQRVARFMENQDAYLSTADRATAEELIAQREADRAQGRYFQDVAGAEYDAAQRSAFGAGTDEDRTSYVSRRGRELRSDVPLMQRLMEAGRLTDYGDPGAVGAAHEFGGNVASGASFGLLSGPDPRYDPGFWRLSPQQQQQVLERSRVSQNWGQSIGMVGSTVATLGIGGAAVTRLTQAARMARAAYMGQLAEAGLPSLGAAAAPGLGFGQGAAMGAGIGAVQGGVGYMNPTLDQRMAGEGYNPAASLASNVAGGLQAAGTSAALMAPQFGMGTVMGRVGETALNQAGLRGAARQLVGRGAEAVGNVGAGFATNIATGQAPTGTEIAQNALFGFGLHRAGKPQHRYVKDAATGRVGEINSRGGYREVPASQRAAAAADAVDVEVIAPGRSFDDLFGSTKTSAARKELQRTWRREAQARLNGMEGKFATDPGVLGGTAAARDAGTSAAKARGDMEADPVAYETAARDEARALRGAAKALAAVEADGTGGRLGLDATADGEAPYLVAEARDAAEARLGHKPSTKQVLTQLEDMAVEAEGRALQAEQYMRSPDYLENRARQEVDRTTAKVQEAQQARDTAAQEAETLRTQYNTALGEYQDIADKYRNAGLRNDSPATLGSLRARVERARTTLDDLAERHDTAAKTLADQDQQLAKAQDAAQKAADARATAATKAAELRTKQVAEGVARVQAEEAAAEAPKATKTEPLGLIRPEEPKAPKAPAAPAAEPKAAAGKPAAAEPVAAKATDPGPQGTDAAIIPEGVEGVVRGKAAKPAVVAASVAAKLAETKGAGATVAPDGTVPTRGFMVSKTGLEKAFPEDVDPVAAVEEYMARPDVQAALKEPNTYVGAWRDDGKLYLDVSERFTTEAAAVKAGGDRYQYGVFDLSGKAGKEGYIDTSRRRTEYEGVKKHLLDVYKSVGNDKVDEAQVADFSYMLHAAVDRLARIDGSDFKAAEEKLFKGGIEQAIKGHNHLKLPDGSMVPVEPDGTVRLNALSPEQRKSLLSDAIVDTSGLKEADILPTIAKALEAVTVGAIGKPIKFPRGKGSRELMPKYMAAAPENFRKLAVPEIMDFVLNFPKYAKGKEFGGMTPRELVRESFNWYTHAVNNMLRGAASAKDKNGDAVFSRLALDKKGKPTNPQEAALFKTIVAMFSPGDAPDRNMKAALDFFTDYTRVRENAGDDGAYEPMPFLDETKLVYLKDENGDELVVGGGGYSRAGHNNIVKLNRLADEKFNGDRYAAVHWLQQRHPVSEVQAVYKYIAENPSKDIPEPDAEGKVLGAFAFGPKVGAFIANVNGNLSELTPDLWWSRTWNRLQGTLLYGKGNKKVAGAPRGEMERRAMRKGVELVARELTDLCNPRHPAYTANKGAFAKALGAEGHQFKPAEAQSLLWYMEQQVWSRQGHTGAKSLSYDGAAWDYANRFAEIDAIRERGRGEVHMFWGQGDPEAIAAKLKAAAEFKAPSVTLRKNDDGSYTVMVDGEESVREEGENAGTVRTYTDHARAKQSQKQQKRVLSGDKQGPIRFEGLQRHLETVSQLQRERQLNQLQEQHRPRWQRVVAEGGAPTDDDVVMLLGNRPEYLTDVGNYLMAQRDKLRNGKLTVRDVTKAYLLTLSSIRAKEYAQPTAETGFQNRGVNMDTTSDVTAPDGTVIPAADFMSTRGGTEAVIRPEDAFAKFLFTPEGKAALDEIEAAAAAGRPIDETLTEPLHNLRQVFGADTLANAFKTPAEGEYTLHNVKEFTDLLNSAGSSGEDVVGQILKLAKGIGIGKEGFIKQLLGFGGTATMDAIEINYWLTGRGDAGKATPRGRVAKPEEADANFIADFKGEDALQPELAALIDAGFRRVAADPRIAAQFKGYDLDPNVFNTIFHHWLWDRAKGTETSHAGFYKAMLLAQNEGRSILGQTRWLGDGPATIDLFRGADISTLSHETAHALRRFLPDKDSQLAGQWTEKVTGKKIVNGEWLVEHEEAFARGFEQYLMEGTVPDDAPEGLVGVYDKMKQYLRAVYEGVMQVPDLAGQLDDTIRGVYDRMLGAEQGRATGDPAVDSKLAAMRAESQKKRSLAAADPSTVNWKATRLPNRDRGDAEVIAREVLADPPTTDTATEMGVWLGPVHGKGWSQKFMPVPYVKGRVEFEVTRRLMTKRLADIEALGPSVENMPPGKARDTALREIDDAYDSARKAYNNVFPAKFSRDNPKRFNEFLAYHHPRVLLDAARARAELSGIDIAGDAWAQKEAALRDAVLGLIQEQTLRPTEEAQRTTLNQESPEAVRLFHYSTTEGLTELDPAKLGTGAPAAETRRGVPALKRTFFYKEGTEPERVVARSPKMKAVYAAELRPDQRIYDLTTDPDGLIKQSVADNQGAYNSEAALAAIRDAGYSGYTVSQGSMNNVVAVFDKVPVKPHPTRTLNQEQPRQLAPEQAESLRKELAKALQPADEGRDADWYDRDGKGFWNPDEDGTYGHWDVASSIVGEAGINDFADNMSVRLISRVGGLMRASENNGYRAIELDGPASEKQIDIAFAELGKTKGKLEVQIGDLTRSFGKREGAALEQFLRRPAPERVLNATAAPAGPSASAVQAAAEAATDLDAVSGWEILTTLRKAGMLSSPKTHLRNIIGNTAFQVAEELKQAPTAMVDVLGSLRYKQLTGGRTTTFSLVDATKAMGHAFSLTGDGQATWEKGGLRRFLDIMSGDNGDETGTQHAEQRDWNRPGLKALEYFNNKVFGLLKAEDALFNAFAMRRSLLDQGRAAVKRGDVDSVAAYMADPPAEAVDIAAADALFATFNNGNLPSQQLAQFKGSPQLYPKWNAAVDFLIPFDRTPTNLFLRMIDYSPLGLVTGSGGVYGDRTGAGMDQLPSTVVGKLRRLEAMRAGKDAFDQRTARLLQREMAKQTGRGLFGTTVLMGMMLSQAGTIVTPPANEEDRGRGKATGEQGSAIKLGGRYYSLRSLAPIGPLLALGAALHRAHEEGEWTDAGAAALKTVHELPIMRGFGDLTDVLAEPERKGERWLGSFASSFIPAVFNDIATLTDNARRRPETGLDVLKQRVPGLRQQVHEDLGPTGEPVYNNRWVAWLDPFASTPDQTAGKPGLAELTKHRVPVEEPKKKDTETDDQYLARKRERGTRIVKELDHMIQSAEYKRLAGQKDEKGFSLQRKALQKLIRTIGQEVAAEFNAADDAEPAAEEFDLSAMRP